MNADEFEALYAYSVERHTKRRKKQDPSLPLEYAYRGRAVCRDLTGSTDFFHATMCQLDYPEDKAALKDFCVYESTVTVYRCDMCDRPLTRWMISYGMTKRPSCPEEFVNVLRECPDCHPPDEVNFFTLDWLNDYFNSGKAEKDGLLWLTV